MRKPDFVACNKKKNRVADQPTHPGSPISTFICSMQSIVVKVHTMYLQACLSLIWLKIVKTGFLAIRLVCDK